MKGCVIIGASPKAQLPPNFSVGNDGVFCADGGYDRAVFWGIAPDVVIGDFDSAKEIPQGDFEVVRLPREKDDTDLLAAVKLALQRGYRRFRILGALGGRLDHSYGNLSVLAFLAAQGATATLEDGETVVQLVGHSDPPLVLERQTGRTVSVFPFGTDRCIASYTGLQYPLDHGTLSIEAPLGVSNVVIAERATITIEAGTALVIILNE